MLIVLGYLQNLDENWFLLINNKLTHPLLDQFFSYITNLHHRAFFLYGVFPLAFLFAVWKYRWRAVKIIFLLSLVVGLSDTIGYRLVKPHFERLRPQHALQNKVRVLVPYYPKSYSLPSNHSMTAFALARTVKWLIPFTHPWVWLIVGLAAYSRIYVGVHYPSDVILGALLGYALATLLIKLVFSRFKFFSQLRFAK